MYQCKKPKKGENTMAKTTITERRWQLTQKVKFARQEFHNTRDLVKYEVRKANPGLESKDPFKFFDIVDNDSRVQIANARLLALCDAANIMGADLD